MLKYFIYYLIAVNVISFLGMGWDKYLAKHNKWRTPETSLFAIAFLGGGIGSFLGMQTFRHKTKKPAFKFGIPFAIVANIVCVIYILKIGILK